MSIFDIFKKLDEERKSNGGNSTGVNNPVSRIICGLGNPGTQYENTRHNCGYMAVDRIAEQCGQQIKKLKFKSLTAQVTIGTEKCLLMKPTTFMNKSGEAVVEAMEFYKLKPQDVLIICDDINSDVGSIKIKRKGSDGGQNGIKNIIYLSGSDLFPRIKIGIGNKPHPDYSLADWVLSSFKKEEGERLEKSLDFAAEAAKLIVSDDIDSAMNEFNGKKAE